MPELDARIDGAGDTGTENTLLRTAVPDPRAALGLKPYRYGGHDTEPDPREIARQVRAEIAARQAAGGHE